MVFENTDDAGHWPASDDHPSHMRYDGTDLSAHCQNGESTHAVFDACEAVPPSASWSFTFKDSGTYSFHDHLWPHLSGVVQVEPSSTNKSPGVVRRFLDYIRRMTYMVKSFFVSPKQAQNDLADGGQNNEFYHGLVDQFRNIVRDENPRVAIEALRRASDQDPRVSKFCHDVIHEVGQSAYEKYQSFEGAITYRSDFCNSGYIHGVFEAYFRSAENPTDDLAKQCRGYAAGRREFDLWQCHHGIGHGFMYLTGGNLDESLALCRQSLDTSKAASSCQNGAVMEVFNEEELAKEAQFTAEGDGFLACSRLPGTAKGHCYTYLPTYIKQQSATTTFADILKKCDQAEFGYKSTCISGVGNEALKRNMSNPAGVFDLCRRAGAYPYQQACVKGAVGMMMNQTGSLKAGREMCEVAGSNFQSTCLSAVDDARSLFES